MSSQVLMAFLLFSVSMSLTPGAGNITLMGISNRYGFLAALPFVAGTAFGVLVVFTGTSAGLLGILSRYPELYLMMKYLGAAYLLYIAWGISNFKFDSRSKVENVSGFVSGALVQILNPKAWIAAMTVFSQFIDISSNYITQVTIVITAFLLVVVLCTLAWAYFGSLLSRLLQSPAQMILVNRCLAGSLVFTVAFMLMQS